MAKTDQRMANTHRSQLGIDFEDMSESTATRFDHSSDPVRQELAHEADVSWLMSQYGVPSATQRQGGVEDQNIDLQDAYAMSQQLREWWLRLPDWMREKYPTPEAVLEGIDNGQILGVEDPSITPDKAAGARQGDPEDQGSEEPAKPV